MPMMSRPQVQIPPDTSSVAGTTVGERLGPTARALKFLDGFYDSLAKPGAVDKLLIGKCRG